MRNIKHKITLTNNIDLLEVDKGYRKDINIRQLETKGIIDTGCVILMIPEKIYKQLGIPIRKNKHAKIRGANGGMQQRLIGEDLRVSLMGRDGNFSCIIGSDNIPVLIGQNVLEELDIIIDSNTEELRFRDPDAPIFSAY